MVLHANSDTNLEPYTTYEYRVSVWNRHGHGFSLPSWVTTKEDVPHGVLPPHWKRVGLRDDMVQLNWSSPIKANGNFYLEFVLNHFLYDNMVIILYSLLCIKPENGTSETETQRHHPDREDSAGSFSC